MTYRNGRNQIIALLLFALVVAAFTADAMFRADICTAAIEATGVTPEVCE